MQLITPMMDYPKLTKQLCHMPGHDILLKATATGDDYNLFRMLKFQEETFISYMHLWEEALLVMRTLERMGACKGCEVVIQC